MVEELKPSKVVYEMDEELFKVRLVLGLSVRAGIDLDPEFEVGTSCEEYGCDHVLHMNVKESLVTDDVHERLMREYGIDVMDGLELTAKLAKRLFCLPGEPTVTVKGSLVVMTVPDSRIPTGPACECGSQRFHASQKVYMSVVVDETGVFIENAQPTAEASIFENEAPYGPFTCEKCFKEYESLKELKPCHSTSR